MECFGPAYELLPKMRELLARGEGFWLTVTGNSMYPTLTHLEDKVYISPLDGQIKKGDILLTRTQNGGCILHRLIRRKGDSLYYQGDALNTQEGPLPIRYVVGRVTKIQHREKIISVSPFYHFECLLRLRGYRFKRRLAAAVITTVSDKRNGGK
ncbi:MAG TPA: S24/S26 family peptidase [Oscillospiraceae bacterium]|nr:S24/S26 family peptidase [Oscillospiraceae bacterium]HPF54945.1 S24/S26 family peptidase [Clostridiales bacterium]HPK35004.1 S24/S26 family peptidase [Oscillospiraceae bacterium]HPR75562.1 S24/S26 family peptidase [Oscillospiraceae bacterium]